MSVSLGVDGIAVHQSIETLVILCPRFSLNLARADG